jgi:hypothetical protein
MVIGLALASVPGQAQEPRKGTLAVIATHGYCVLTVDGIERGPTPIVRLELTQGTHELRCMPPGGPANARKVAVKAGERTVVRFDLPTDS